jgi:hypothetical protein
MIDFPVDSAVCDYGTKEKVLSYFMRVGGTRGYTGMHNGTRQEPMVPNVR